jgi:hypothetical protein
MMAVKPRRRSFSVSFNKLHVSFMDALFFWMGCDHSSAHPFRTESPGSCRNMIIIETLYKDNFLFGVCIICMIGMS